MSALDLVIRGLHSATGLSITSRGLVLLESTKLPVELSADDPRVDVRLGFDLELLTGDVAIVDGDLEPELTLRSAVLMSLFSDRRATPEEMVRFDLGEPRGYWGDFLAEVEGDRWGSALWMLDRRKRTNETRNLYKEFAEEALRWMVDDGIAESVEADAVWLSDLDEKYPRGYLGLGVDITRPVQASEQYAFVWGAEDAV
jgi:phage gp46-like protein